MKALPCVDLSFVYKLPNSSVYKLPNSSAPAKQLCSSEQTSNVCMIRQALMMLCCMYKVPALDLGMRCVFDHF